jgi:hypothetical protein
MSIEAIKETVEKLSKENKQYQEEIDQLEDKVKSYADLGQGFTKIGLGIVAGLANSKQYLALNDKIHKNNEIILGLSTSVIFDFLNLHHMADIKSLHDNGFDFIPTKQLEKILDKAVANGKLEKIPLADTTLYKINEQS